MIIFLSPQVRKNALRTCNHPENCQKSAQSADYAKIGCGLPEKMADFRQSASPQIRTPKGVRFFCGLQGGPLNMTLNEMGNLK